MNTYELDELLLIIKGSGLHSIFRRSSGSLLTVDDSWIGEDIGSATRVEEAFPLSASIALPLLE
jgi:hypothetical protein